MPIDTLETTRLEEIEDEHDLDKDKRCEWMDCTATAEYWLICPVCSAREYQCAEHTLMIRTAPIGATVIFDRTCQHRVQQCTCHTEKIAGK